MSGAVIRLMFVGRGGFVSGPCWRRRWLPSAGAGDGRISNDRKYERGAVLMYVFMVDGAARDELRTLWDLKEVEAEEAERGGCWPSLFIGAASSRKARWACEEGERRVSSRAERMG